MKYLASFINVGITVLVLLLSNNVLADGCDDLAVTIDNNTGLTIKGYYTDNSSDNKPEMKVITVPAYNRNFSLPLVINKDTLPLVYTDIIIKAESEQTWLGVEQFKTNVDMPLHDDVISITKYYRDNGELDTAMNFIATKCQRIKRLHYDNGEYRWDCDFASHRDVFDLSSQDSQKSHRQMSDVLDFDSTYQKNFKVRAELVDYGHCGSNNPADAGQPGKVVIHISS